MARTRKQSGMRWSKGLVSPGILTVGNPILERPCRLARKSDDIPAVSKRLLKILRREQGAGLAAPQIGLNIRVAVIESRPTDVTPDRPHSAAYVLVNPRIIGRSRSKVDSNEGCFSVPGYVWCVKRYHYVTVRFRDEHGRLRVEKFTDYLAYVAQHECDHLDGQMCIHRAGIKPGHLQTIAHLLASRKK